MLKKCNCNHTGEGADAHKARVTETQLTQDSDGEVERERHDDIYADGDKLSGEATLEHAALFEYGDNGKGNHQHQKGNEILPRGF